MNPSAGADDKVSTVTRAGGRPVVPRQRPGAVGVRLLVVSDHDLVGEAVRMALTSRGFDAVSLPVPVGHGRHRDFIMRVNRFRPGAGLLLCELEDRSLVRDAASVVSSVRVNWLVLTRARDGGSWGALAEAGVAGILPMTTSLDALSEALLQVAAGKQLMSDEVRKRAVADWRREGAEAQRVIALMEALTPREMAVLASLHDGLTVKVIARDGAVSEGTVRSQVKSILRKLEVSSQLAAVAAFRQLAELSSNPPEDPSA